MTQAGGPDASRLLLQRVREVAATVVDKQDRLDGISAEIADVMGAEVCSIYIRHGEDRLLLTATKGLNRQAVHNTTLAIGEGLVGMVAESARPVNLPEAAAHENFAYRPETGEEAFHSFVGVPLLRGGLVVGVMTVQNVRPRLYARDEVDALQTVAMLVAEVAAAHEPPSDDVGEDPRPVRLEGRVLNAGVALGAAYMHEARLPVQSMVSGGDSEGEIARVDEALEEMHRALDDRFHAADLAGEGEHREVLQAYRMFAEDRGWLSRIHEAVRGGLSAEGAVVRIQEQMRARMRQLRDPFFRERLHDLEDLSNRLLEHLAGEAGRMQKDKLPADAVLVARHMGPAELLDYPRERLRALLLEEGSHTAHVVIVARALDIPVLGDLKDISAIAETGDRIAVDGQNGQVFIRPGVQVEQNFHRAMQMREERRAQFAVLRDKAARSVDGVDVSLSINAGLLIDIQQVAAVGAEGVGLYRTEIPFMVRSRFPDVEDQKRLYSRALDLSGGAAAGFPDSGHRRRQGSALLAAGGGRESSDGLAGPETHPRSAANAPSAAPGLGAGGRRPRLACDVSDGRGSIRIRASQGDPRYGDRTGEGIEAGIRPPQSPPGRCSKCRRSFGNCRPCCRSRTLFRLEATTCCSSFSPPIARIRGWRRATTCCRRRCLRSSPT